MEDRSVRGFTPELELTCAASRPSVIATSHSRCSTTWSSSLAVRSTFPTALTPADDGQQVFTIPDGLLDLNGTRAAITAGYANHRT